MMLIITYLLVFALLIGLIFIFIPYFKASFPPGHAQKPWNSKNLEEFSREFSQPDYAWKGALKEKIVAPELPEKYGDNRLVLMAKNPEWLYAYWEISASFMKNFAAAFPQHWASATPALRVYQVSGAPDKEEFTPLFDIGISDRDNNWFIHVPSDNRNYCVELGRKLPDGKFITLLRSETVLTPRASVSTVIDENWVPCDIYGRLSGVLYGISSAQLYRDQERKDI